MSENSKSDKSTGGSSPSKKKLESRVEKYFDEEKVEDNNYKITFSIPKNLKRENILIKYKKNGFYVEFTEDKARVEEGWTYHCTNKGYYSRSFPYVVKNLKAMLESDKIVLTFERSDESSTGHNILEIE